MARFSLAHLDLAGPESLTGRVCDARPCSLPRLRNQYRHEVLLSFDSAGAMLAALDRLRGEQALKARVRTLTVDVDAVSLT